MAKLKPKKDATAAPTQYDLFEERPARPKRDAGRSRAAPEPAPKAPTPKKPRKKAETP